MKAARMSENDHDAERQAAVYITTSSRSVATVISQINTARNFARRTGIEVVGDYIDLRDSRVQLIQLIEDATADDPPFRKILAFDLTHIYRHAEETSGCRERLAANRIELIAVDENRAVNHAPTSGETAYSEHSDRVRRGMRETAQRGFYAFARAPYGYRKVESWDSGVRRFKLEPDPPASNTVRRIYDRRLQGASRPDIAAELNANGVRSPSLGDWGPSQVARVLRNEVYCGTSLAPRQDMGNPDTAVRVRNAFPAIISQEKFDLVRLMEHLP